MKNSNIILTGSALLIGLYLLTRPSKAEEIVQEGIIIPYDTNIYGNCFDSNCIIGQPLIISVTFKNIGFQDKENIVGILINNEIVKEGNILLVPDEEYIMTYDLVLEKEISYDICGVVK